MDACSSLDALIAADRNFAVYRIPGEEFPRWVLQNSGPASLCHRAEDLNALKGFVIAPFRIDRTQPVVLIRPDATGRFILGEEPEKEVTPAGHLPAANEADVAGNALYQRCFRAFTAPLLHGELDKLVLSRREELRRPADFSPGRAFVRACRRYTHSYVYLCHTPRTGTWLGSTPEIILSGKEGAWQTVALAGTQPFAKGMRLEAWDAKNRREQQIVAAYIRDQLATLGIGAEENGPYPAKAGELAHLKSDFRFTLRGEPRLGDLLALLHPTPAVCGLPKEKAYRFILDNEGYERSYYSGFIGWMDPEGQTDLYVNLRCTHIGAASFTLYAGGGLLASSQLEEEWQETEDKLQTMKAILYTAGAAR